MKRLLLLLAVLFPISCFVAGCGGAGKPAPEKSEPTQEMVEHAKLWASGKVQSLEAPAPGSEKNVQSPKAAAPGAEKKN